MLACGLSFFLLFIYRRDFLQAIFLRSTQTQFLINVRKRVVARPQGATFSTDRILKICFSIFQCIHFSILNRFCILRKNNCYRRSGKKFESIAKSFKCIFVRKTYILQSWIELFRLWFKTFKSIPLFLRTFYFQKKKIPFESVFIIIQINFTFQKGCKWFS